MGCRLRSAHRRGAHLSSDPSKLFVVHYGRWPCRAASSPPAVHCGCHLVATSRLEWARCGQVWVWDCEGVRPLRFPALSYRPASAAACKAVQGKVAVPLGSPGLRQARHNPDQTSPRHGSCGSCCGALWRGAAWVAWGVETSETIQRCRRGRPCRASRPKYRPSYPDSQYRAFLTFLPEAEH